VKIVTDKISQGNQTDTQNAYGEVGNVLKLQIIENMKGVNNNELELKNISRNKMCILVQS
jgi:hypothetical protein